MKLSSASKSCKISLALAVIVISAIWFVTHDVRSSWYNVPPAPTPTGLKISALGDAQLAYRQAGLSLQTMGDTGGRVVPLNAYDYDELSKWFRTLYGLDSRSDFVPMLAAFYFGASQDSEDVTKVVDFLEDVGYSTYGEKWRWLVHAVYLARYREKDTDRALELAKKLAELRLEKPEMPVWTLHMAPFILADLGEDEAADELLKVILGSAKDLHPNEINFMMNYLDRQSQN